MKKQNFNPKSLTDHVEAHKHSSNHRILLEKDTICGCFHCCKLFAPSKIEDWIDDKIDSTAICPYCGIDSVIGESSGYPITEEFLKRMSRHWFGYGN